MSEPRSERRHPEVVASHTNSEGEFVTIERVVAGPFAGQYLLVIHDDPPLRARAPMLLDAGTVAWLQHQARVTLSGRSRGSDV